jgi:pyruvate,orthophosphate dikinase
MKYVYFFNEGSKDMKNLLGGKGANLAQMTNIGLPVPLGFTITTESCIDYYDNGLKINPEIIHQIHSNLHRLEEESGKGFGSLTDPLLVSVRSGAPVSMPGMMDTILNLGLNDATVVGLSILTSNKRFVLDSYRRFIQMFSDVVLEIHKSEFEAIFDKVKREQGAKLDNELTEESLEKIIAQYKTLVRKFAKRDFPQDVNEQLFLAIEAVFKSWNNNRAKVYRRINNIEDNLGTAVNVQSMVFGNMGSDSGTGVAFTRDPNTGENVLYGEYLIDAQGEDVVAGIRTPQQISSLKDAMPHVYEEFNKVTKLLEDHYSEMQDIEFTVERGKLYILQTRTGKRSARAAVKIAMDMFKEGRLTKEKAIQRVTPQQINQLLHPEFDVNELKNAFVLGSGLPASPGAAYGKIVFNSENALEMKKANEKVILVRQETSPEDIEGMVSSQGILTLRGGMTSHAAVVARGMGKCCIAGCSDMTIVEHEGILRANGMTLKEGDYISLDGSSGKVYLGQLKVKDIQMDDEFSEFLDMADSLARMKVRTNADTPKDSLVAVRFGATGIGLCRTEHMFFEKERIFHVREMILANDITGRKSALDKLIEYQTDDFHQIFNVMNGKPVNIRLLDPPLHEFLPKEEDEIYELSKDMNINIDELKLKINQLSEFNPMLGHRGVRLAISYPEIYEMQVNAILNGAKKSLLQIGVKPSIEIMVPLIGMIKEFQIIKNMVNEIGKDYDIDYKVGTMIEIPRACVISDQIANEAQFFSFGTNDLTQMTLGFSRDDSGKFLPDYIKNGVFSVDPFASIDVEGVGSLVEMSVIRGRKVKEDLKVGVCGEHGGDPDSIIFFNSIGLDYVSCSPFRVPVARLVCAQANIPK